MHEALRLPLPKRLGEDETFDKKAFVKDLKLAVYAGILGAYVQGMHVSLMKPVAQQHVNIRLVCSDHRSGFRGSALEDQLRRCDRDLEVSHIASLHRSGRRLLTSFMIRAGCIIQSDGISDILQPIYTESPGLKNLLENPKVAKELRKSYESLKKVCKISLESDSISPAFDATLSWLKQTGCDSLPTSMSITRSWISIVHSCVITDGNLSVDFEEAELDYVSQCPK